MENTILLGEEHASGSEGDAGSGSDIARPDDVHQWLAGLDSDDIFRDLDAFDLCSPDHSGEVELVVGEDPDRLPQLSDEELALAALSDLPKPLPRKKGEKKNQLRNLSEEDFEAGVERLSYMIIKGNIEAIFDKRQKPEVVKKAIQWVFGRTNSNHAFATCCDILGTRIDVLRLRVHFEFWRRWMVFPFDLPFLIDPVPDRVEGEIIFYAGEEGYHLARAAWLKPGISSAELIEEASAGSRKDAYYRSLELLAAKYLMSQQGDSWYLTGRNPILKGIDLSASPHKPHSNQISWSKMF